MCDRFDVCAPPPVGPLPTVVVAAAAQPGMSTMPVPTGHDGRHEREVMALKKLLLVALAAVGGFFAYRQIQADRAEQELWTEATDPVPAAPVV